MSLTSEQLDRAAGALLGAATGDALGVPYEFGAAPIAPGAMPRMIGGGLGPYAPGEWSDDTQMALCIAQALLQGGEAYDGPTLDCIALEFLRWQHDGASDIGMSTRAVLQATQHLLGQPEHSKNSTPSQLMRESALAYHQRTGRSGGNGALMRTTPIALRYLRDAGKRASAAQRVAGLTHFDPVAAESCVIWCHAIATAVLEGTVDGVDSGPLQLADGSRQSFWFSKINDAMMLEPQELGSNGYTVTALQAAWSAIHGAYGQGEDWFRDVMLRAVHAGDDTDTVAAIAGALAGAIVGASGIPADWKEQVSGWPGMRAADLTIIAQNIAMMGAQQ